MAGGPLLDPPLNEGRVRELIREGGGLTAAQVRDVVAAFIVDGDYIAIKHRDADDKLVVSADVQAGSGDGFTVSVYEMRKIAREEIAIAKDQIPTGQGFPTPTKIRT